MAQRSGCLGQIYQTVPVIPKEVGEHKMIEMANMVMAFKRKTSVKAKHHSWPTFEQKSHQQQQNDLHDNAIQFLL